MINKKYILKRSFIYEAILNCFDPGHKVDSSKRKDVENKTWNGYDCVVEYLYQEE